MAGPLTDDMRVDLITDGDDWLNVSSQLQCDIFKINQAHGFHNEDGSAVKYDRDKNMARLALIHTEVSEAVEEVRSGRWWERKSEKINFNCLSDELADVVIRCFDMAQTLQLDLGGAIWAKMAYNQRRPYRHGKDA